MYPGRADSEPPCLPFASAPAGTPSGPTVSGASAASGNLLPEGASGESASTPPAPLARTARGPRTAPRGVADVEAPAGLSNDDPEVSDPVEPEDPLASANASGIADMPTPMPRATASAPTTRPTYRA